MIRHSLPPCSANDDAVPLRAYGNVADAAADLFFHVLHVVPRRFREIFPLAHAGNVALPSSMYSITGLALL